jgi:hypothetical protein
MDSNVEKLTDFEKNILIKWYMYHLQWHDRMELMENFPKIYYKMTGVQASMWTGEKNND